MSESQKDKRSVIKVLNLYAGAGGNRKLWDGVEVTAVEIDSSIAAIYKDLFLGDKVVVGDAQEYLVKNYKRFDFIWSSPPCQSHSRTIYWNHVKKVCPNMALYEEIIFLKHHFYGKWAVENVQPYYEPLIKPQIVDRHAFWANFIIPDTFIGETVRNDEGQGIKVKMKDRGIHISNWRGFTGDKRQVLNNCVYPELGNHVLKAAFREQPGVMHYVK